MATAGSPKLEVGETGVVATSGMVTQAACLRSAIWLSSSLAMPTIPRVVRATSPFSRFNPIYMVSVVRLEVSVWILLLRFASLGLSSF